MDLKETGNLLYLVGMTRDELGGSLFSEWSGKAEGQLPQVSPKTARAAHKALHQAITKGVVRSAHNLSEGGLGVAVAEMAFSGDVGAHIELDEILRSKDVETSSGYLVAPFDGEHGWYFSNETDSDITITLSLSGFYTIP